MFTTCLTDCVSCPVGLHGRDIAVFPDLSNYFGGYNVMIADNNNGQSCENESQLIINQNFPFSQLALAP